MSYMMVNINSPTWQDLKAHRRQTTEYSWTRELAPLEWEEPLLVGGDTTPGARALDKI